MTDELKPCPFCGTEVEIFGGKEEPVEIMCGTPNCAGRGIILGTDRETSINAWNRRSGDKKETDCPVQQGAKMLGVENPQPCPICLDKKEKP